MDHSGRGAGPGAFFIFFTIVMDFANSGSTKRHFHLPDNIAQALCSSQKILQNFSDFSSHRIFRHMHEVLNIDKNKN